MLRNKNKSRLIYRIIMSSIHKMETLKSLIPEKLLWLLFKLNFRADIKIGKNTVKLIIKNNETRNARKQNNEKKTQKKNNIKMFWDFHLKEKSYSGSLKTQTAAASILKISLFKKFNVSIHKEPSCIKLVFNIVLFPRRAVSMSR